MSSYKSFQISYLHELKKVKTTKSKDHLKFLEKYCKNCIEALDSVVQKSLKAESPHLTKSIKL